MDGEVLNLNELFGQGQPIKLLWGDREYLMLRPEAFGPAQTLKVRRLEAEINRLQTVNSENPELAEKLNGLLDKMLLTLCLELPVREIPFAAKLRAINFYKDQISKNALKAALRQIGVLPSAN